MRQGSVNVGIGVIMMIIIITITVITAIVIMISFIAIIIASVVISATTDHPQRDNPPAASNQECVPHHVKSNDITRHLFLFFSFLATFSAVVLLSKPPLSVLNIPFLHIFSITLLYLH